MARPTKRSPLKQPPLRNPGQSTDERVQELILDKVGLWATMAAFAVVVAALEWIRSYAGVPPQPFVMSVAALGLCAFAVWRIRKARTVVRQYAQGRDGEMAVGQYLEDLRARGYRVFHDVPGQGRTGRKFNIDHVLVGPAGIFAIETKTISKPMKRMSEVRYDGKRVTVDGWEPDRDPIKQARALADYVGDIIRDGTGRTVPVRPVVLYVDWFVKRQPKGTDVWVLNQKALPGFLDYEPDSLTPEAIEQVAGSLAKHVRELRQKSG